MKRKWFYSLLIGIISLIPVNIAWSFFMIFTGYSNIEVISSADFWGFPIWILFTIITSIVLISVRYRQYNRREKLHLVCINIGVFINSILSLVYLMFLFD